jgi:hypothetical protein
MKDKIAYKVNKESESWIIMINYWSINILKKLKEKNQ